MQAQNCLYFVNFYLVLLFFATIMKFWKLLLKIAFCFLYIISVLIRFKEEKYGKLYQRKSEIQLPKIVKFPFSPAFRLEPSYKSKPILTDV